MTVHVGQGPLYPHSSVQLPAGAPLIATEDLQHETKCYTIYAHERVTPNKEYRFISVHIFKHIVLRKKCLRAEFRRFQMVKPLSFKIYLPIVQYVMYLPRLSNT